MKIGIDCRFWGPKHTGLGRYTKNLVLNLLKIDKKNFYNLFLRKEDKREFPSYQFENYKLIETDFPHYSFKEQVLMPIRVLSTNVDLMHFPHFNIPIFYPGKFVVTIHDLIKNFYKDAKESTHNPLIYYFKYLNYRFVIKTAIKRATKIITPSKFIKNEIIKNYKVKASRIEVIYEAIDTVFNKKKVVKKKPGNYFLYVGNLSPHKNLIQLIEVFKNIKDQGLKIKLLIVGKKWLGYKEIKNQVKKWDLNNEIIFTDFIPDQKLKIFYQQALAFITPSLMEGFGLPGLEALNLGCPVLSSNRGSLPEIYKDAAIFFNPEDRRDLEEKIRTVFNFTQEKRKKIIEKGIKVAKQYSWIKCAQQTLKTYQEAFYGKNFSRD